MRAPRQSRPSPSDTTIVDIPIVDNVECGPLVAGGDSLVRRTGHKVLFVEGAIPGEHVNVQITKDRKDRQHGHVVEIVQASPQRVAPPCPMVERGCGGCQLQHIAPAHQAELKVRIVEDALRHLARIDTRINNLPVNLAGAVPATAYRTTLHLGVVNGRAALRKRQQHDLVPLDTCLIAHPYIAELIEHANFGTADEVTLRAGAATGERLALVRGDISTVELPSDVLVTADGHNTVIHEDVAGQRFRISARSFFQSGPAAAELLAEAVDAVVYEDAEWIVDAYAGVGVLGAIAAQRRSARLTAIENDRFAAADARHNVAELSLDAEVLEAEVARVQPRFGEAPDVVIANPARSGLGPSAAKALCNLEAPRLILVSCDPASLARDAGLLSQAGYQLQEVAVLDLFPHTHHVETVSVFET